jgi:DNA polymerase-3 subunit delta'
MTWESVIGQGNVKRQIRDLLATGRLAHAYLFHGVEGTGKDAMALELARALHCDRSSTDPCGACPPCVRIGKLQYEDLLFVTALPTGRNEESGDPPLEKLSPEDVRNVREQLRLKGENPYHRLSIPRANVIKVNSIRDMRREVTLSTTSGKRRVVIISKAEDLQEDASNMLLKTLEEPIGRTMFILTTAHPEALLPTIRSRCHSITFEPLQAGEIRDALVSRAGVEPKQATLTAHLAMGSYTRALDLLREDIAKERDLVLQFVRGALGPSFIRLMSVIDEISSSKDRVASVRFLNLLLIWFRDALVLREGGDVINIDQKADLDRFVRKFPEPALGPVLREIEKAVFLVERNGYIPLVLVQLAVLLRREILQAAPHLAER